MRLNPGQKELIKNITHLSARHGLWNVFSDFIEVAAIAISNSVDQNNFAPREAAYMNTIQKYNPDEQQLFPQMFAQLVAALETEVAARGPADLLGTIYHELELHNERAGQFFTPDNICEMMANLSFCEHNGVAIKEKGYLTVSEPACGSGAMILAFARVMAQQGYNYCSLLVVTAQDIDLRCVQMCYLQLSLCGIPAVVIHGNTLTLEEWSRWYTPVYIWNGWLFRQACGMTEKVVGLQPVLAEIKEQSIKQLAMFR
jgi:type I restriction-modification system DNA methylase subunit